MVLPALMNARSLRDSALLASLWLFVPGRVCSFMDQEVQQKEDEEPLEKRVVV